MLQGRKNEVLLFNWAEFQFFAKMKQFQVDGSDDCLNNVNIFHAIRLYSEKIVTMVEFYIMYILSPFKQNGIFCTEYNLPQGWPLQEKNAGESESKTP